MIQWDENVIRHNGPEKMVWIVREPVSLQAESKGTVMVWLMLECSDNEDALTAPIRAPGSETKR